MALSTLHFWKFKRELKRIQSQLKSFVEFFYEPILRNRQYKQRLHPSFVTEGHVRLSSKVAIFLIYQPNGIAKSSFATCQYLLNNSYSPLIVINGSASDDDIEKLKSVSWRIIRRNNYGYDFGGYQDAIWFLQQSPAPECLVILNDSVWLPAIDAPSILYQMESKSSDLVGALQLEAHRAKNDIVGTKPPFFGSFFIHVKESTYRHPSFLSFWKNYKATSNKQVTIRRGERFFSRSLMDAGVSHDYIFSRRLFDQWLDRLDSEALMLALCDLVSMDPAHENERQALLDAIPKDNDWHQLALNLAKKMTEKQNILSSAPIASLKIFQVPYIKKSADPHHLRALALIVKRHHEGAIELDRLVFNEICDVLQRNSISLS